MSIESSPVYFKIGNNYEAFHYINNLAFVLLRKFLKKVVCFTFTITKITKKKKRDHVKN